MSRRLMPCGFCADGKCDWCPGTVKNAATPPKGSADRTWTCPCYAAGHPAS